MTKPKSFLLFCAGEDSGDCIGETLVASAHSHLGSTMDLVGVGGARMVSAGLNPLLDFDQLPVSGFGDVLSNIFKLRRNFKILETALKSPYCKGLVAIDYPGFNMKLTALACKLNKPVLYVAPPQVWAWKSGRAKKLSHPQILLAHFFDFEKEPYLKFGSRITRIQHPLSSVSQNAMQMDGNTEKKILLLPGSRIGQASRNLDFYISAVQKFREKYGEAKNQQDVVILASRQSVFRYFKKCLNSKYKGKIPQWLSLDVVPQDSAQRLVLFSNSYFALTSPGTATLELALAGCKAVVCTIPDKLTYVAGRFLVDTKWFSLPNLVLGKELYKELIFQKNNAQNRESLVNTMYQQTQASLSHSDIDLLKSKISEGKPAKDLMLEFLAQFL